MIVPKTVEAAVALAHSALDADEIKWLIEMDESQLIREIPLLGAKIRNHIGLWQEDATELLGLIAAADPGYFGVIDWSPGEYSIDADGASGILLGILKRQLMSADRADLA